MIITCCGCFIPCIIASAVQAGIKLLTAAWLLSRAFIKGVAGGLFITGKRPSRGRAFPNNGIILRNLDLWGQ